MALFQDNPGKPVRLRFTGADDDGGGGDKRTYKTCKAPVNSNDDGGGGDKRSYETRKALVNSSQPTNNSALYRFYIGVNQHCSKH